MNVSEYIASRLFLFMSFFYGLSASTVSAQQNALYNYQDLSKTAYTHQKDSLKKFWVCPALYKDKSTQAKYKEFWNNRTSYIATAIDNNNYIKEQELFNYLNSILTSLTAGNKKLIKQQPLLLIDRSSSVNAYAVGGNIIAVNVGLLCFAESREEIALVLAHELSHNILQHPDNSMREKAEYFTSEEYKKSLDDILKEKYERYSRLKKVVQGYSIDRSRHNRYHEGDADSLAIELLKNSGIGFDARFFLRLDSADMQYRQPLLRPLKDYFAGYDMAIVESWTQKKAKGLSTRNYNFKDSSSLDDSLKTHPDCVARYEATAGASVTGLKLTPIPVSIKEKATRILIWNQFDNMSLTACLYRVLLQKDKGATDVWYDFMVHNILQGLYLADKQLNRFRAIGIVPKEYISKDYYALQTLLEQMPRENLEQYCVTFRSLGFWQQLPADANGLKVLMATLNENGTNAGKASSTAAKTYLAAHNASMYCEFASHFK